MVFTVALTGAAQDSDWKNFHASATELGQPSLLAKFKREAAP